MAHQLGAKARVGRAGPGRLDIRSFVQDISTDPDEAAIVTAIVAMARSLNLSVTAEGVETEAQAVFLRSLSCELAQGFHFGRPMPAIDFALRLGADTGVSQLRSEAAGRRLLHILEA